LSAVIVLSIPGFHRVGVLKIAVSTNHVVVGIFLIVYSSIDPINTTLPFSLIMCCNSVFLVIYKKFKCLFLLDSVHADNILGGLGVYQKGFCLVLCPWTCNGLVMYQPRTLPLALSAYSLTGVAFGAQTNSLAEAPKHESRGGRRGGLYGRP